MYWIHWIHMIIALLIIFLTPHIEKVEITKKDGVEVEEKSTKYFYVGLFLGLIYWLFATKYFI